MWQSPTVSDFLRVASPSASWTDTDDSEDEHTSVSVNHSENSHGLSRSNFGRSELSHTESWLSDIYEVRSVAKGPWCNRVPVAAPEFGQVDQDRHYSGFNGEFLRTTDRYGNCIFIPISPASRLEYKRPKSPTGSLYSEAPDSPVVLAKQRAAVRKAAKVSQPANALLPSLGLSVPKRSNEADTSRDILCGSNVVQPSTLRNEEETFEATTNEYSFQILEAVREKLTRVDAVDVVVTRRLRGTVLAAGDCRRDGIVVSQSVHIEELSAPSQPTTLRREDTPFRDASSYDDGRSLGEKITNSKTRSWDSNALNVEIDTDNAGAFASRANDFLENSSADAALHYPGRRAGIVFDASFRIAGSRDVSSGSSTTLFEAEPTDPADEGHVTYHRALTLAKLESHPEETVPGSPIRRYVHPAVHYYNDARIVSELDEVYPVAFASPVATWEYATEESVMEALESSARNGGVDRNAAPRSFSCNTAGMPVRDMVETAQAMQENPESPAMVWDFSRGARHPFARHPLNISRPANPAPSRANKHTVRDKCKVNPLPNELSSPSSAYHSSSRGARLPNNSPTRASSTAPKGQRSLKSWAQNKAQRFTQVFRS